MVGLIAQHEHSVAGIMKIAGVSRQSVFNYRDKLVEQGLEELLKRDWAGARTPVVHGELAEKFIDELKVGTFRQARDAQKWIEKRTRKKLTEVVGENPHKPVRLWVLDEHRYGLLPVIRKTWSRSQGAAGHFHAAFFVHSEALDDVFDVFGDVGVCLLTAIF